MSLIDSIINAESGGNATAKNPNSSATGAAQFISSTWLDTLGRHRPDLVQGRSPEEILALRNDPQLSREMAAAYAADNGRIISQAGYEVTPGSTYLAHFAGPQGAVKVLQSDPSAPVGDVLGAAVVKANPFLARMTAGDLQAWAAKKVGGSTPQSTPAPASPAAPANGLLSANAGGLLQAPIFPAQQAPLQPQQAAPDQGFQMPGIDAPPIFFAQRRMPDLSKLKAAIKPPVFRT
jgi:hypothetical protein